MAMCLALTTIIEVIGLAGNLMNLGFYGNTSDFLGTAYVDVFRVTAAWAWCIFALNTTLTGLIIARIAYVLPFLRAVRSDDRTSS